jgi:hypothetical protein
MFEKRKDERIELKQPVILEVLSEKLAVTSSHNCKVREFSAHGARIATSARVEAGMRVRLKVTFQSASAASLVAPLGTIKWVKTAAGTDDLLAGIELSKVASPETQKWSQFAAKKRSVIF